MSPIDLDLSLTRIEEAARTIDPVFVNTPQYADEQLNAALGRSVVVKVEIANPLRSFKGRGADFFMSQLGGRPTVVCSALTALPIESLCETLSAVRAHHPRGDSRSAYGANRAQRACPRQTCALQRVLRSELRLGRTLRCCSDCMNLTTACSRRLILPR